MIRHVPGNSSPLAMKVGRVARRVPLEAARDANRPKARRKQHQALAFTLIEVMVVVGIMGLILIAGIPSLSKLLRKTGMRKVVSDVVEVCSRARAQAILHGAPVDVLFHPREGTLAVSSASPSATDAAVAGTSTETSSTAGSGFSARIPDDVIIEMLDINLAEYRESEWARVRFYPNGTSDEMTFILRSSQNEWRKISLEVTTGLASVEDVR